MVSDFGNHLSRPGVCDVKCYGRAMGRVAIAVAFGVMLSACSIQVLPVPVGGLAGGPSGTGSGGGGAGGGSSSDSGAPADAGASDAADAAAE